MSVEEIKSRLRTMSPAEQDEVSNFLKCLRQSSPQAYRAEVAARLDDKDPSHWVSLNELERRFPDDWPNE